MHRICALLISILPWLPYGASAEPKPLKVFVLVGQSNMQGHAHVRTLEHLSMDPATRPLLAKIQTPEGKPRVSDQVWVAYLSPRGEKKGRLTTGFGADDDKIGPELMCGIHLREALDQPILIIKAAWGGKSLHTDFRPPGAKPETAAGGLKKAKPEAVGHTYRQAISYVRKVLADPGAYCPAYDKAAGYELAGFVWFQGWNDMVAGNVYPDRARAGGYDGYSELLTQLIADVRKDLKSPALPFVIGVMGVGGPVANYRPDQKRYAGIHQNFRDAMAAPARRPELKSTVAAVLTERYWDAQLSDLRHRRDKVRAEVRRMKLGRAEARAKERELLDKALSKEEQEIWARGVSNLGFHYNGSAKIMVGIGKGFAEALIALRKETE